MELNTNPADFDPDKGTGINLVQVTVVEIKEENNKKYIKNNDTGQWNEITTE